MNTSRSDPMHEPPHDEVLAGEYVLGVLGPEARQKTAARVAHDSDFAREVTGWERRLAPMLDAIDPVCPPSGLWLRVRAQVGLTAAADAAAPEQNPLPLWERLGFWRGFSVAALAATTASLGALLALHPPSLDHADPRHPHSPHPITMLTTIANTDGSPAFIAAVDNDACTVLVMPTAGAKVPAGKVAELWVIGGDGAARSLGVRDTRDVQAVTVPVDLRDWTLRAISLAVTAESPGGSPTGVPTGALLAQGALARLTLWASDRLQQ